MIGPCESCLRRTWLVGALAGHIQRVIDTRSRPITRLLSLSDEDLLAALGGERRGPLERAYQAFDSPRALEALAYAGLDAICQHDHRYPHGRLCDDDAPAVLHVAGDSAVFTRLCAPEAPIVAIVGSRRASLYGREIAQSLGRDLTIAGVAVVSGMALGADSAAHEGALEVGATIAILASGADQPYPASKRALYRRILETGCAVSEFAPGFRPHKWCFPARNRIIAGLSDVTIVTEAKARSGSLITAGMARDLGREVGAVPGQVTSPLAAGTHQLIADGAGLVRDAADVLDLLFASGRSVPNALRTCDAEPGLEPRLRALLRTVASGSDSVDAIATTAAEADHVLDALSELEMLGLVRRDLSGHYAVRR